MEQTGSRLVLLLKLRLWLAEKIRPNDLQTTLFYAGVIGFLGGVAMVSFRYLSRWLGQLLTWQFHEPEPTFDALSWPHRLIVPTLGGLAAGLFLLWGKRVGRSGTSTDYMEAVALGDGVVPFRFSLIKSGSALFTVASGGSIGREGPVVALSAMLASGLGRWLQLPATRLRLLVACGAAAGIASVNNAPIAGALFVAEIILGSLAMESLGPLVFSSVIATLTVHNLWSGKPLYIVPPFQLNSNWEMIPHTLLGLACGFLAPWYLRFLQGSERLFTGMGVPILARLALGGLVVGALSIVSPDVCGNGYSAIDSLLHGDLVWCGVLLLLVLKLVATAATFGSGAVGGVFTPTIFVGACMGYLLGGGLAFCLPWAHINPYSFVLVGMGAFLAAATQAPLMSILVLFELTLDYQIILPLMLACVLAYYTCRNAAGGHSIYSESLKRKSRTEAAPEPDWVHAKVGDLMRKDPPAVLTTAGFGEIAQRFITTRFNYLYVVDRDRHFRGAISLHDVKPFLNATEMADLVMAQDIVREDFKRVTPGISLREALGKFARHDGERLPVVSEENDGDGADHDARLLGSISKTDLILAIANQHTPGGNAVVAQNA
jgi:CIC family chloride channel protein